MAFVTASPTGALASSWIGRGRTVQATCRPQQQFGPCRAFRSRRLVIRAAAPRTVTADELEVILNGKPGPVILDAFAKWCGPCQFLIPQLDMLAERMGDRIQILKLDTDEEPDYASAIGVRGLPTLFFIQDGKLKHRMEGALNAEDLAELSEHFFFDGPVPSFAKTELPQV
jgi:thioredoxin 1